MSNIFDFQNQMVIRFPEEIAEQLHEYFENGGDEPEVTIQTDYSRSDINPRIALEVGINDEKYKATVVEMPTISSTFKTIDRVNFFKSNDVSEMIMVHESEYDLINECDAKAINSHNSGTWLF